MTTDKPIITPEGRASFCYVFQKQQSQKPDGKDSYSLNVIFDEGANLHALTKAAEDLARATWPEKFKGKADGVGLPKSIRSPFRDCEEYEKHDGYQQPGTFVTFRCDRTEPRVIDTRGQALSEGDFGSGDYCRVSCRPYAVKRSDNPGISFSLHNVQKTRDGVPLGTRPTEPEDDFDDYIESGVPEGAEELLG